MENNTNVTNNIQKPISLIIEEGKTNIINTINELNLHPTLLEPILKDIYAEVQMQARMTLERETAEYNRMRNEANNNKEEISNEEASVEIGQ